MPLDSGRNLSPGGYISESRLESNFAKPMERRESADSALFEKRFWHYLAVKTMHLAQLRLGCEKPIVEKENQYDVCRPFFAK